MGRLPESYQPAEWRNTTPVDEASLRIGLGFNLDNGIIVRLGIPRESAVDIMETLKEQHEKSYFHKIVNFGINVLYALSILFFLGALWIWSRAV